MMICWLRTKDLVRGITKTEGKLDLNWTDYSLSTYMKSVSSPEVPTKCHVVDRTDIGDNLFEYRVFVKGVTKGQDSREGEDEGIK
eukprot:9647079-Ditylum_brightwellii.AAC.1